MIVPPLVGGDELEKEPHRVAVAAHRRRPESFDGDQMVDEEGLQQRPEGGVSLIVASPPPGRDVGRPLAAEQAFVAAGEPG